MESTVLDLLCHILRAGLQTGLIRFNGSLLVDSNGKTVEIHAVGKELVLDELGEDGPDRTHC